MKKKELMKLTKQELINKCFGMNANIGRIRNILVEYKAHIHLLQSRIWFYQRKIDFMKYGK